MQASNTASASQAFQDQSNPIFPLWQQLSALRAAVPHSPSLDPAACSSGLQGLDCASPAEGQENVPDPQNGSTQNHHAGVVQTTSDGAGMTVRTCCLLQACQKMDLHICNEPCRSHDDCVPLSDRLACPPRMRGTKHVQHQQHGVHHNHVVHCRHEQQAHSQPAKKLSASLLNAASCLQQAHTHWTMPLCGS